MERSKEELKSYSVIDHKFTYAILEGVLPVSNYVSTVSVTAAGEGKTKVVWNGNFKRKDTSVNPAKGQTDEDAVNTMHTVYKGGLDNLKKLTEHN